MAVHQAEILETRNFSIISAHVRVPPAIAAILASPDNRVQSFLAPGHVCTIMGVDEYRPIVEKFLVPIVVTGFEPLDWVHGVAMCVRQLEEGRSELENQYTRSVRSEGNLAAKKLLAEVFVPVDRRWRGLDTLPNSGLALRERYAGFDAIRRFDLGYSSTPERSECRAGEVLRGLLKPPECRAFGKACTPEHPLGAPMVSTEGACAAYLRSGRFTAAAQAK